MCYPESPRCSRLRLALLTDRCPVDLGQHPPTDGILDPLNHPGWYTVDAVKRRESTTPVAARKRLSRGRPVQRRQRSDYGCQRQPANRSPRSIPYTEGYGQPDLDGLATVEWEVPVASAHSHHGCVSHVLNRVTRLRLTSFATADDLIRSAARQDISLGLGSSRACFAGRRSVLLGHSRHVEDLATDHEVTGAADGSRHPPATAHQTRHRRGVSPPDSGRHRPRPEGEPPPRRPLVSDLPTENDGERSGRPVSA